MATIMRTMLLVLATLFVPAPFVFGQQPSPDLILLNGRIFTSDLSHPYVEALAIRGDRITGMLSPKSSRISSWFTEHLRPPMGRRLGKGADASARY